MTPDQQPDTGTPPPAAAAASAQPVDGAASSTGRGRRRRRGTIHRLLSAAVEASRLWSSLDEDVSDPSLRFAGRSVRAAPQRVRRSDLAILPVGRRSRASRSDPEGDRGSFTAELAACLPALVLLLAAGLTAVSAATTRGQCLDAAREAALATARGGSGVEAGQAAAPPGATVEVWVDSGEAWATVEVAVPALGFSVPGLTVTGTAVAATEPGSVRSTE